MPRDLIATAGRCPRCAQAHRACRSCQQRRRLAWRLIEIDGLSVEQAATRMREPLSTVRALVAQQHDRLELRRFKLDSIPTARVRAFLEQELARDPELSRAEVAHRMNMRQADLDRQLGYTAGKDGRAQQRVGIPAASRLTLALGRDPHELEGC